MNDAKLIQVCGVVQGVGFRPFIYGLATHYGLKGQVANTAKGVDIIVEGSADSVKGFIQDIQEKKPVLSHITSVAVSSSQKRGFTIFEIIKSSHSIGRFTMISPDVCVCKDCLEDLNRLDDRRFEYPFVNCTNCGPRFSIIKDVPYDRSKTSMRAFRMCPACQAEYDDPLDRRFHAQPNACSVCGPQIFLTDNKGNRMDSDTADALESAAGLLTKGNILSVKGLGGFHLVVDAGNEHAVALLRERKKRPDKPFALMAASARIIEPYVHMNSYEQELLQSFHRPIVLLHKKSGKVRSENCLAPSIARHNSYLGVMLPYTPLHYLLLKKGPGVLVMTSGNRSGEPLSVDNEDALDAFSHIADYFLLHNRDIYFRADDSIARVQNGETRFLRRSRGYAPLPVDLKPFVCDRLPAVLGCGAGLKSTICLTRDRYGFISQHIGDLENQKVTGFYDHTIAHISKIMDITPEIVAHDLHPGYYSSLYAKKLSDEGFETIGVQHHHAHALSCMAENQIEGEVIALTLDGAGLGDDGHIWGGEVLICSYRFFRRLGRLEYIQMPGGDAAAREPWRMAASLLYHVIGKSFLDEVDIPYVRRTDFGKLAFLIGMMEKKVNTPLTSSAGRLFDAISSLLGIRHVISYESQAAMELEALADGCTIDASYPYNIEGKEDDCMVFNLAKMVWAIIADIKDGIGPGLISAKFHNTLVAVFVEAVIRVRERTGLNRVVLSGGVFNNDRIFTGTVDALEKNGFSVYTHSLVPCGDGGIALGQAMAGAAYLAEVGKNSTD